MPEHMIARDRPFSSREADSCRPMRERQPRFGRGGVERAERRLMNTTVSREAGSSFATRRRYAVIPDGQE
ncbi:hypothetical protein J4G37_12135 [Microvirga sp. 3-52]|nr:hypothetical protein [Microvirga sp. 3-52]